MRILQVRFLADGYLIYWQMTNNGYEYTQRSKCSKCFPNSITGNFQRLLLMMKHGFTILNQCEKLETTYCKPNTVDGDCSFWKNHKHKGVFFYYVFFSCKGLAVQLPVPKGQSITGRYYIDFLLKESQIVSSCLLNDVLCQEDLDIFIYDKAPSKTS